MRSRGNSKISLELLSESVSSWTFEVYVNDINGQHKFTVELDKEYHNELTKASILPLILVQESMFFLLEHEPLSAILRDFNLNEIQNFFPTYEQEILKKLNL